MAMMVTATLTRRISMRLIACLILANFGTAAGWAQESKYPPLSEYMMPQEAEVPWRKAQHPKRFRHMPPSRYSHRPDTRLRQKATTGSSAS